MTGFFKYINWPLILLVPWLICCPPNVTLANDQPPVNQVPAQKLELRLEGERLSALFRNVPLREVAKALETKTHAYILMNDPDIANEPVSASVHASTLKEAMKIILNGFSYALGPSKQGFIAVVLSTPPQRYREADVIEVTCLSNPADTPKSKQSSTQTPDETRQLIQNSGDCSDSVDPASTEEDNQQQEVLLQQSLDILNSPQRNLYANAIEQLGMIQNELANATLIKFAMQTQQGPERYLATEALARIAIQSQFKDTNVMMTLEQLATDQNEDIRRSAGLVIEQMQQEEALASK